MTRVSISEDGRAFVAFCTVLSLAGPFFAMRLRISVLLPSGNECDYVHVATLCVKMGWAMSDFLTGVIT